MNKEKDYKRRFWLIVAALLILVWFAGKFGFSRTIALKHEIEQMRAKTESINDAPERLQAINKQLERINQFMGDLSGEEINLQLMEHAGRYSESSQMSIRELPEKHLFSSDDYTVITIKLVTKGNFRSMLGFLHELETNSHAGRLHSACFESVYDINTNRKELYCTYYIQTVGKNTE